MKSINVFSDTREKSSCFSFQTDLLSINVSKLINYGTIHLRRRQILTIFDPYPPIIDSPEKCL